MKIEFKTDVQVEGWDMDSPVFEVSGTEMKKTNKNEFINFILMLSYCLGTAYFHEISEQELNDYYFIVKSWLPRNVNKFIFGKRNFDLNHDICWLEIAVLTENNFIFIIQGTPETTENGVNVKIEFAQPIIKLADNE